MTAMVEQGWTELPQDIMQGIVDHIQQRDVQNGMLVCREWRRIFGGTALALT